VKVYLEVNGERREAVVEPNPSDPHVVVAGACPACQASPFKVAGVPGSMTHDRDTCRAPASCTGCSAPAGQLVVVMDTLFGIEEDRAVLVDGRARVY
jgi:hypothetical protein